MKPGFYFIFVWLILLGCHFSSARYSRYGSFPHQRELQTEPFLLDTALLRYPFRVHVKDSVLLVMDLHPFDYYFHAFTYPGGKHIVSFGQRGEAPEEMLSVETFHFLSLDSIWTLDANKMQITRWSLSLDTRLVVQKERVSLDKKLVRVLDFCLADSCFLIPDYLGKFRMYEISRTGERLRSVGYLPTEKPVEEEDLPALAQAWRSFLDFNPSNGVQAWVTQLGEVLEIYHRKDSFHTVLYGLGGEPLFQTSEGEAIPTGMMGFSDVQVTNQAIYAVFHGRSFKEIMTAYQKDGQSEDGGRIVYVFDLKGKPVCKYILDRAIYGIHVDETRRIVIATDVNSSSLLQFKI